MSVMGSLRRRLVALRAIAGPLRPDEEEVAFHYACDAAWQIQAVRRDEQYFETGGTDPADAARLRRLEGGVPWLYFGVYAVLW